MGKIYKIKFNIRSNFKYYYSVDNDIYYQCYDDDIDLMPCDEEKDFKRIKEELPDGWERYRNEKCYSIYNFYEVNRESIIAFFRKNIRMGEIDSVIAFEIIKKQFENNEKSDRKFNENRFCLLTKPSICGSEYSFVFDTRMLRVLKAIIKIIASIMMVGGEYGTLHSVIHSEVINEFIEVFFANNEEEIIKCCDLILHTTINTFDDIVHAIAEMSIDILENIKKIEHKIMNICS